MAMDRDELLRQLVEMQYDRNDIDFERGTFRVRGDVVEIFPAGRRQERHPGGIFRRRNRPHQPRSTPSPAKSIGT